MVVSGFHKFPFHGRLILYLLPLVFLMLGRGIHALTEFRSYTFANTIIFITACVIILNPIIPTSHNYLLAKTYVRSDLKSVLAFVQENAESEDSIYQYHRMGRLLPYYAADYGLQDLTVHPGGKHSDKAILYDSEIDNLPRDQRIWFVFTFVGETRINKQTKQNEREYILNILHGSGTLLTEYYGANDSTSAHLFILE